MNGKRLVLITRRFWPLVGGAETVMAGLASTFQENGWPVTLLTARWEKSWPAEIVHRDVRVVRLQQPRRRGWGTLRYMRGLRRWMRQHRDSIDLVLASMLKHDAYAAVRWGSRHGVPIVVRAEGGGTSGDCNWQTVGRLGMHIREATRAASAWIAPSRSVAEELIDAGYPAERGHTIANGVPLPEARSEGRRLASRQALSDAHPILKVNADAPLVVFTGRLHRGKGLLDLVDAWPAVLSRFPEARLWLIGEGPDGPTVWERIRKRSLTARVIMPGSFDDLTDVLRAADAFVLPSYEEGLSMSLLEAMAVGLPVAASDIPGNRPLIADGKQGLLFPAARPELLAASIVELLEHRAAAERLGQAARQRVTQEYTLETMAQRHLELFVQLIKDRDAVPSGT